MCVCVCAVRVRACTTALIPVCVCGGGGGVGGAVAGPRHIAQTRADTLRHSASASAGEVPAFFFHANTRELASPRTLFTPGTYNTLNPKP